MLSRFKRFFHVTKFNHIVYGKRFFSAIASKDVKLDAVPGAYSSLQALILNRDGTFKMLEGGGQAVTLDLKGTYSHKKLEDYKGTVTLQPISQFYRKLEPSESQTKIRSFNYTVEKGLFVFRYYVPASFPVGEEPCIVYNERYVVDADPFRRGGGERSNGGSKYFYDNCNCIELQQRHLSPAALEVLLTYEKTGRF